MTFQPGEPLMVLVEWEDAYNGDHAWLDADALPEAIAGNRVRTLGWLVREKPERITLAMSVAEPGGEKAQLCDLFTIPRGCVRRVTVLGDSLNGPAGQRE